jgi:formylglycine-generating enzyme required for sulfatase activity
MGPDRLLGHVVIFKVFGWSNNFWIPPGTFMMGSPSSELDRYANEGPQTRVTISRGFWMAKSPVTQLAYSNVMKTSPSHFPGTYLPVDSVTWSDATNYCGKLTQNEKAAGRLPTNYVYRLPTEAEREYATRAGTTTRFSYGDDLTYTELAKYAWFATNYLGSSHLIAQKLPNPWGLFDLHGNVMEWCLDYLGSTLPAGPLTDPKYSSSTTRRTLRGGSMASQARDCRSAFRLWDDPASQFINAGFRVLLAPPLP